jgi:hypothetical protein
LPHTAGGLEIAYPLIKVMKHPEITKIVERKTTWQR